MRAHELILTAVLLASPGAVRADVDLSGEWEIYTSVEGVDEAFDATVTQSGTALTIAFFPAGPLSGTIDPVSGAFSVGPRPPSSTRFPYTALSAARSA